MTDPEISEMLAEAKDSSEPMIDLAYAALLRRSRHGRGGRRLEETLSEPIQDMRGICILAVRNPREAEGMSSVLQVISAIERMANDAVDIAGSSPTGRYPGRTGRRPVPSRGDLARVLVSEASRTSPTAHCPLTNRRAGAGDGSASRAAVDHRRRRRPDRHAQDARSARSPGRHHPPAGARRRRQMDAAGRHRRSVRHDLIMVDVLVEMKDISEVAVTAYSALVLGDPGRPPRCASSRIASTK